MGYQVHFSGPFTPRTVESLTWMETDCEPRGGTETLRASRARGFCLEAFVAAAAGGESRAWRSHCAKRRHRGSGPKREGIRGAGHQEGSAAGRAPSARWV